MEAQVATPEVVAGKYDGYTYNEIKAYAKIKGYPQSEPQTESAIIAWLEAEDAKVEAAKEPKKLGRKIDPNSERQKRLAEKGPVKTGFQGRPVDNTTPSRQRKNDMEARRAAQGGGPLPRGRKPGQTNGTKKNHTRTDDLIATVKDFTKVILEIVPGDKQEQLIKAMQEHNLVDAEPVAAE